MSRAYYSENDKFAAAWLRELIKAGAIAPGDVDERDIRDVRPDELFGYTQWHLFAGIGAWSYALRAAGFPDSRPVLTVSCPCQPFSSAGKGAGAADERHLWPAAFHIISQLKAPIIFGEQVSSAINHGWWDLVEDDLAGIGYEVGQKDFPACSVGAFHKRQRLYFVGERREEGLDDATGARHTSEIAGTERETRDTTWMRGFESRCVAGELANPKHPERRPESETNPNSHWRNGFGRGSDISDMALSSGERCGEVRGGGGRSEGWIGDGGESGSLEHSPSNGRESWGTESGRRSVTGGCESSNMVQSERIGCECIAEQRCSGLFPTMDGSGKSREPVGAYGASIGFSAHEGFVGHADDPGPQGLVLGWKGAGERIAGKTGVVDASPLDDSQSARRGIQYPENIGSPDAQVNTSSDASNSRIDGSGFFVNWHTPAWLWCRDGKYRAVERTTQSEPFAIFDGPSSYFRFVCLSCGSETEEINELLNLQSDYSGQHEDATSDSEILLDSMFREESRKTTQTSDTRELQGSIPVQSGILREVRCFQNGEEVASAPQGSKSSEQCEGKYTNTMCSVPWASSCGTANTLLLCNLWKLFRGQESSQTSKNLFCGMCKKTGLHIRKEEMVEEIKKALGFVCDESGNGFISPLIEKGKNRVGRLRGYGNALCAKAAQVFIESYLETQNNS